MVKETLDRSLRYFLTIAELGSLSKAAGYTPHLLSIVAEQRRKLAEQRYTPASWRELQAIAHAQPPASVADLQATVVELLDGVQRRVRADNADSWRGFYNDRSEPHLEERCRDYLLTMLGVRPESIDLDPEAHSSSDTRADIAATFNGMRLPIEIKGQWHSELWRAADSQLDRLYAIDHAADRRGIYIVLWFGHQVPTARLPVALSGGQRPQSATELAAGLFSTSRAAQEGRVTIYVLDLARAQAATAVLAR